MNTEKYIESEEFFYIDSFFYYFILSSEWSLIKWVESNLTEELECDAQHKSWVCGREKKINDISEDYWVQPDIRRSQQQRIKSNFTETTTKLSKSTIERKRGEIMTTEEEKNYRVLIDFISAIYFVPGTTIEAFQWIWNQPQSLAQEL